MAAQYVKFKAKISDQFNIPELVEEKHWDSVLVRLDKMKFYISYTDRDSILRADQAPVWLKNAAHMCKVVPSC